MHKIFIEPVSKLIELKHGINTLVIENVGLYRKLFYDFDKSFIFSKDDKVLNNNKIVVITNPLEPDINSKKNLSTLYKRLESNSNPEDDNLLKEIEGKIIHLIDRLTLNFDIDVEIDDQIDLNKIFGLVKLKISEINNVEYLDLLLNYIKIVRELTNSGILVFYGLSPLLSNKEYMTLKAEIKLLDVEILDICNIQSKHNDNVVIIDEDYCIL